MAREVLTEDGAVAAAGGVVWREASDGRVEVLLIHRPKYDDWTFPKGKRELGERDEQTAIREVEEETGLHCQLGQELHSTEYHDRHQRQKRVRYWEMTPVGGKFVPTDEVDAIRWLAPADAASQLTHEHDGTVLESFLALR